MLTGSAQNRQRKKITRVAQKLSPLLNCQNIALRPASEMRHFHQIIRVKDALKYYKLILNIQCVTYKISAQFNSCYYVFIVMTWTLLYWCKLRGTLCLSSCKSSAALSVLLMYYHMKI